MKEYSGTSTLLKVFQIVRAALSGKQNVLTPQDGLYIDGNSIGITSPVRGIFTQEEYDALPEAERSKGLYVVDD